MYDTTAPVFSMSKLCKLYSSRLHELGGESVKIHTTRLRQRLQAAIPDLTSTWQEKEYILVFDKNIGDAQKKACSFDSEL